MNPAFRYAGRHAQAAHQHRFEAGTDELAHQGRGRVVAAAALALLRVHHPLEHAAQHVRGDQVLPVALAHREVKSLEQVVERIAPIGVTPARRPVAPLQGRRLEQPAIQERQPPQQARGARAIARGAIERPEAERVEHVAMKPAPRRERCLEAVDQVLPVTIEPSLRLDEVEEQHPCEGRERECVPVGAAARRRAPVGEPHQRGAEGLVEPCRDSFARECLARAQAQRERGLSCERGAALERGERASRHGVERERCGPDAEPCSTAHSPGGADEPSRAASQGADEPALRSCREAAGAGGDRPLRVSGVEGENAKRVVPRDQCRM